MERELVTDSDVRASLEPDAIVDPYSLDYDSEAEMERWFDEQAREARQVREDAEQAIWYAEQIYGDPVAEEDRATVIENLITAHYDARSAGRDGDDVFAVYNALQALYASLPNAGSAVFGPMAGARRVPQQRSRSSRRRRSARTRKSRSPGQSGDADRHLRRSPKAHRATCRISALLNAQFSFRAWLELLAHLAAELRSLPPLTGALALELPA